MRSLLEGLPNALPQKRVIIIWIIMHSSYRDTVAGRRNMSRYDYFVHLDLPIVMV